MPPLITNENRIENEYHAECILLPTTCSAALSLSIDPIYQETRFIVCRSFPSECFVFIYALLFNFFALFRCQGHF